ncbi:MAG TPA: hypothetical protein VJA26_04440, partial [Gammaproteobacteria bacterium]|nr:hypothetical protein [Gammaproteobacteria bacterium]
MSSTADSLLGQIETFCRQAQMAESTFGRRAVNDGKLCARLRDGKDVTLETADRIKGFIQSHGPNRTVAKKISKKRTSAATGSAGEKRAVTFDRPFRFYDNRQKYLAFVNTTNEKRKVAERASRELAQLRPRPPALRVFDAGMGDGT